MKWLLVLTILGHIITGYTDCMMTFLPNGRFSFAAMSDPDEMDRIFEGASLKKMMSAVVLGVFGLTICYFGYQWVAEWMVSYSKTLSMIMYVSAVVFFLPGISHHVFCGVAEWMFIKLDRTSKALDIVVDFFKSSSITMYVCYIGLLVYSIALFIGIVTGMTPIPRWGAVFNPAICAIVGLVLKVPAATNVAGVVTFLGLAVLM